MVQLMLRHLRAHHRIRVLAHNADISGQYRRVNAPRDLSAKYPRPFAPRRVSAGTGLDGGPMVRDRRPVRLAPPITLCKLSCICLALSACVTPVHRSKLARAMPCDPKLIRVDVDDVEQYGRHGKGLLSSTYLAYCGDDEFRCEDVWNGAYGTTRCKSTRVRFESPPSAHFVRLDTKSATLTATRSPSRMPLQHREDPPVGRAPLRSDR